MVEVATVGNEGMAGVPVFLGSGRSSNVRVVCRAPGESLSIPADAFRDWQGRREESRRVIRA